jgi:thiol:disulfide interchange protein
VVAVLSELAGIDTEDNVEVFLDRDAFTVKYDAAQVSLDDMYAAIIELGYRPGINELDSNESESSDSTAIPELVANALLDASNQGKILLLDFYAEWCIACKALDADVFSHPAVMAALDNYIFLKIDTDEHEEVASYYKVVGMPSLVILSAEGLEIHRSVGMLDPEEYSQKLNELFEK